MDTRCVLNGVGVIFVNGIAALYQLVSGIAHIVNYGELLLKFF